MKRKLRVWRKHWQLTQSQAAAALGVTRRTLENWEQGVRAPRGLALESLLHKLTQPPP